MSKSNLMNEQSSQEDTAKLTFYILRHGETDANASGKIQGSSDFSRLTEKGRNQARSVFHKELHAVFDSPSLDSIFCSPLTRTLETLDCIKKERQSCELKEIILNDLREIDFYDWEGKSKEELKEKYPESWKAWKQGDPFNLVVSNKIHEEKANMKEKEETHLPLVELWDRSGSVWNEIHRLHYAQRRVATTNSTSLIVAHGSLAQALLGKALGWSLDSYFRKHEFPNCGLVEIQWNDFTTLENMIDDNKGVMEEQKTKARLKNCWRWRYPHTSDWKYEE